MFALSNQAHYLVRYKSTPKRCRDLNLARWLTGPMFSSLSLSSCPRAAPCTWPSAGASCSTCSWGGWPSYPKSRPRGSSWLQVSQEPLGLSVTQPWIKTVFHQQYDGDPLLKHSLLLVGQYSASPGSWPSFHGCVSKRILRRACWEVFLIVISL